MNNMNCLECHLSIYEVAREPAASQYLIMYFFKGKGLGLGTRRSSVDFCQLFSHSVQFIASSGYLDLKGIEGMMVVVVVRIENIIIS